MILKLKNLAIAIMAMLAMAAMSAPAASAAEFHTGLLFALDGEQHAGEDRFTVNAGVVTCSHITYTGELQVSTSSTLSLAPSASGCRAFGFVNTTIDWNGCEYVFDASGGSTEIACPAGKSIVTTAFNCWVTVGPQSLKTVTFTNNEAESSRDITIDMNLTGISYTQHSKSFPGCSSGSFSNGTYAGAMTLQASIEQPGIWYE